MLSLSEIQTFSDTVTVMIMVATVSLCPTLFLTLHIKSKILVFIITIIGNGVLYGISGAIIGLGFALFRRATARNRSEEGHPQNTERPEELMLKQGAGPPLICCCLCYHD